MARIRSIKPEYASDGKIRRLSDSCALFFALLWAHCDDYGYFTWDPVEIQSKVCRWRVQEVSKFLSALVRAGLVRCSSSVGVGLVEGWEHQKIKDRRASKWIDTEIEWDPIPRDAPESDKNRPGEERRGRERKGEEVAVTPAGPAAPKPSVRVWEAYSQAYRARYGAAPTRNARVNGQIAQFVARVPAEEAEAIAAFYVTHQNGFYVAKMHPVGLMLQDAEKLRTEWLTGRQITNADARQAEKSQQVRSQMDRIARGEL